MTQTGEDPARRFTDALGRVHSAVDGLLDQAERVLPLLRQHEPGEARPIDDLLTKLRESQPELRRLLERFERKTDLMRWWLMQDKRPE
jgi:hypothetical protein